MIKENLIGMWVLVEYRHCLVSGDIIFPFGKGAAGCLIYTSDDHVSVHLMTRDRPLCHSDHFGDSNDQEKIEIAENYGGYFGRYKISGDVVIHYPHIASFPNLIDRPQERKANLSNGLLVLSYQVFDEASAVKEGKISWRRS